MSKNQNFNLDFRQILKKKCLKTKLSGNRTVIECLKSKPVQISDTYCMLFLDDVPIDSLQLMMDAADGKSGKNKIISDEEITANAFVFILAG